MELPEGEIRVGRGRQADIMLKDLAVSRHHVTLFYDGRTVRARDEGSGNGTLRNGAPIVGDLELTDGDEIELGETTFRLVYPRVMVESGAAPARGGPGTVKTRQPERDMKPLILIAGGALALAVLAVVVVSFATGGEDRPPPPPPSSIVEPTVAPSQPPPIVISVPTLPHPDAGVAAIEPPRERDRRPTRNKPRRGRDRDRDGDRDRREETASERRERIGELLPDRPKPVGVARAAQELYEEEDFAEAARTLRNSGNPDLSSVARDYATVGAGLARGDANAEKNPMIALTAYQEALAADVRSGDSIHAPMIRERLGKVAPAAARAFFDVGRYEHARAACDIAVNFRVGGDPRIAQTRELLEGAAADLFRRAQALEGSDPSEAELLYRRILKIVPSDSDWARKAVAALRG